VQPDVGGVWRQEVLRRMQEAQQAEAAARPAPPPGPRRRITVRWRAAAGRLRRGSPPVAQTKLTETRPEIDLTETVTAEIVLPDGLATSGTAAERDGGPNR
jgi:hypothetical protein